MTFAHQRRTVSSLLTGTGQTRRNALLLSLHQKRCFTIDQFHMDPSIQFYDASSKKPLSVQSQAGVAQAVKRLKAPCLVWCDPLREEKPHVHDRPPVSFILPYNHADAVDEICSHLFRQYKVQESHFRAYVIKRIHSVRQELGAGAWSLALTIERDTAILEFVLSPMPGINPSRDPRRFRFQYRDEIPGWIARRIAPLLGPVCENDRHLWRLLSDMYKVFKEHDATHLELTSLSRATDIKGIIWQHSKLVIDDAAAKRQKKWFGAREPDGRLPEEAEAGKHGLVYVKMDGDIGTVVNGAGLAMVTNDAIAHYGGSSANFLDAGGQATKETMLEAFRIVLSNENVKVVLVNVYGGITRCDMIAESIIDAAKELGPLKVPIVARLKGTNSAQGLELLESANLGIHVEAGFGEAAQKAVELSKRNKNLNNAFDSDLTRKRRHEREQST